MIKSLAAIAFRVVLVFGVLAIGASAVWATPIDCSQVSTMSGLTGAGSCKNQDKIYSNFANVSIPSTWTVSISESPNGPGSDYHDFTISAPTGGPFLTAGTYTLDYLISIDPTSVNYALNWITSVQVSYNLSSGIGSDTKGLFLPTYNSDGVFTGPGAEFAAVESTTGTSVSIGVDAKAIYVEETVVVSSGFLHSITDDFIETETPEPATMALMGAGLLALGGLLRRKRLAK